MSNVEVTSRNSVNLLNNYNVILCMELVTYSLSTFWDILPVFNNPWWKRPRFFVHLINSCALPLTAFCARSWEDAAEGKPKKLSSCVVYSLHGRQMSFK